MDDTQRRRIDIEWWAHTHHSAYHPENTIINTLYVRQLLEQLPLYLRQVMYKMYWKQQTQEEIAHTSMGRKGHGYRISRSMVSRRHVQALKLLKAAINKEPF